MSVSSHYQGEQGAAYHAYQRQIKPDLKAEIQVDKLRETLPLSGRIVDFGCGPGSILSILPADEKIGVDVISENRDAASERGLDVRERLADVPDRWADAVLSHHSLEHTLNPLEELREMRRVLKPGGTVVVYVPADDWRMNRKFDPNDVNHHLFTWTPLALGHLLTEAGFSVRMARVRQRALPGRATEYLYRKLPPRAFTFVTIVTAYLRRRREIVAIGVAT